MVRKATKSEESPRPRGRPRAFDRDEVIDKAVGLFWRTGFEETSLDDIVGEIGISRSTLYDSFGGKDGLSDLAANRYRDQIADAMATPLVDGSSGIDDILAFLDRLRALLLDPANPAGCLVVNSMTTPRAATTGASDYLESFRSAFLAALSRAVTIDGIDESLVEPLATTLITQLIGLSLLDKSGAVAISDHLDATTTLVSTWRK